MFPIQHWDGNTSQKIITALRSFRHLFSQIDHLITSEIQILLKLTITQKKKKKKKKGNRIAGYIL